MPEGCHGMLRITNFTEELKVDKLLPDLLNVIFFTLLNYRSFGKVLSKN